jgi:hypothetical protein
VLRPRIQGLRPSALGIDRDQGKAVTLQKTQPPQLTLWQTFFPSDPRHKDQDAYSNTAELYDAVPKYFACRGYRRSMSASM